MQSVQYFEKFWGHITLTFDPSDKKNDVNYVHKWKYFLQI